LQQTWYNLSPLRYVIGILNLAAKGHWKYSKKDSDEFFKYLDGLSRSVEPDEIIEQYEDNTAIQIRGELFDIPTNELQMKRPSGSNNNESQSSSSSSNIPQSTVSSLANKRETQKYQRSNAFERIQRKSLVRNNYETKQKKLLQQQKYIGNSTNIDNDSNDGEDEMDNRQYDEDRGDEISDNRSKEDDDDEEDEEDSKGYEDGDRSSSNSIQLVERKKEKRRSFFSKLFKALR